MYRIKRKKVKVKKRFYFIVSSIILMLIAGFIYILISTTLEVSNITPSSSPLNEAGMQSPYPTVTAAAYPVMNNKIPEAYLPASFGLKYELTKNDKLIESISFDNKIDFGSPEVYSQVEGVTGFRGNNYRNSASFGFADIKDEKLEKVWFSKTGYIDEWTGVGWTGQPSIINWDDSVRNIMNISEVKRLKSGLKEVIYATLDGKIYFLDLDDGKQTRKPIDTGFPHKGSVAVDPRGYPLLYAGQGINSNGDRYGAIGHRIYSLIDQKQLYFINGIDNFAFRNWGAFDGNPLINGKADTMLLGGENGLFYNVKLNSNFKKDKGTIEVSPEPVKFRYRHNGSKELGSENSVAVYKNYAYFADNSGTLMCVDINSMNPVWVRSVTDDTDSTIVIEEESSSEVYLYTASGVDIQGIGGLSHIRKINAFTGETLWESSYPCVLNSSVSGGTLATPVVGKNNIKDLVIFNIAKTKDTPNSMGGRLIAFDKKSGKEVWNIKLANYCWSSPVDFYAKNGKSYLIQCDSLGNMLLINPKTGKELDRINLEANVEGSPAMYDNMIVVGTRGQKIWGIKVK